MMRMRMRMETIELIVTVSQSLLKIMNDID